jgi:hypothetical protein
MTSDIRQEQARDIGPTHAGTEEVVTIKRDRCAMTWPVSHKEERRAYAEFASHHAEEEYRRLLAELYSTWSSFNHDYFDGKLTAPHLAIGRTAPRSLGHCSSTTDYGGKVAIVLNDGLVFGTNRNFVVRPWMPAAGTRAQGTERFIGDLLLRLTVRQYVLETLNDDEPGYRGFGPKFAEEANRIGNLLGLSPVVDRNRPPSVVDSNPETDERQPLARGWPHCVYPDTRYGDDITDHALALARGPAGRVRRTATVPTMGLLELIESRLARGMVEEVRLMIRRHLEWVGRYQRSQPVPRRRAEAGKEDVDGRPLGEVTFDRTWIDWNDGTVLRIARGIVETGSYWDLPILADALTDAGCGDERILNHLRAPMEHGRRCWVLRLLLALGGP